MVNTNDFVVYFFLLPIATSIISAIIFWVFFSVLPERTKKQKIKPILYSEMSQINQDLFEIFESVMRHSAYTPSFFQKEIQCGTLSESDYRLGLTNKCWNGFYLYYPEVNDKMDVIGDKILSRINAIEKSTDRIFSFNQYLSTKELNLLSEIRKLLEFYDIDYFVQRNPVMPFGHPVDPSMAHFASVLKKLNVEYQQLKKLVIKNTNAVDIKIHDLLIRKEYIACRKLLKKRLKEPDANPYLWPNLFDCEYNIGNRKTAIEILSKCFEQLSIDPISIRHCLSDKLDDVQILELIRLKYGQKKVESVTISMQEECQQKEQFIEQQHDIADFVKKKIKEVHNRVL